MTCLVIAEHNNQQILPSTLNTINAAIKINKNVHILVAGSNCSNVAEEASKINNVAEVILCDNELYENFVAEPMATLITSIAENYSHILAPATTFGKNITPRISAKLDVAQISDISGINSEDTFVRPIYAGNALATVKSHDAKKIITVRSASFDKVEIGQNNCKISSIDSTNDSITPKFISHELSKSERPELTSAKIIVSGGRGVGSSKDFEILEKLADKLGAAVGASRAAVDAGYVPNDYQVGQTGKIVAPELYIAVGISGAIQHLAGMKDSKTIVAINKDDDAPIFQVSDYGLVGDLFELIPELSEKI
jgi:electron transfer flavoprotein alpha subunit